LDRDVRQDAQGAQKEEEASLQRHFRDTIMEWNEPE
jgi:hypothetical protein